MVDRIDVECRSGYQVVDKFWIFGLVAGDNKRIGEDGSKQVQVWGYIPGTPPAGIWQFEAAWLPLEKVDVDVLDPLTPEQAFAEGKEFERIFYQPYCQVRNKKKRSQNNEYVYVAGKWYDKGMFRPGSFLRIQKSAVPIYELNKVRNEEGLLFLNAFEDADVPEAKEIREINDVTAETEWLRRIPASVFEEIGSKQGQERPSHERRSRAEAGTPEEAGKRRVGEAQKREAEQAQKREAEQAQKRQTEEAQKREAEEAQKRQSEEVQKRQTEELQKREAKEAEKRRTEQAEKRQTEEAQKRQTEEAQKREAEQAQKRGAEQASKRQTEEASKRQAEEGQKRQAEESRKPPPATSRPEEEVWGSDIPGLSHSEWDPLISPGATGIEPLPEEIFPFWEVEESGLGPLEQSEEELKEPVVDEANVYDEALKRNFGSNWGLLETCEDGNCGPDSIQKALQFDRSEFAASAAPPSLEAMRDVLASWLSADFGDTKIDLEQRYEKSEVALAAVKEIRDVVGLFKFVRTPGVWLNPGDLLVICVHLGLYPVFFTPGASRVWKAETLINVGFSTRYARAVTQRVHASDASNSKPFLQLLLLMYADRHFQPVVDVNTRRAVFRLQELPLLARNGYKAAMRKFSATSQSVVTPTPNTPDAKMLPLTKMREEIRYTLSNAEGHCEQWEDPIQLLTDEAQVFTDFLYQYEPKTKQTHEQLRSVAMVWLNGSFPALPTNPDTVVVYHFCSRTKVLAESMIGSLAQYYLPYFEVLFVLAPFDQIDLYASLGFVFGPDPDLKTSLEDVEQYKNFLLGHRGYLSPRLRAVMESARIQVPVGAFTPVFVPSKSIIMSRRLSGAPPGFFRELPSPWIREMFV